MHIVAEVKGSAPIVAAAALRVENLGEGSPVQVRWTRKYEWSSGRLYAYEVAQGKAAAVRTKNDDIKRTSKLIHSEVVEVFRANGRGGERGGIFRVKACLESREAKREADREMLN